MEQSLDLMKYVRGVIRRYWLIALILFPGMIIAAGVAYVLPPVYESTARILVESQKIPTSLAQSTVTVAASERLQLIRQRVLARENVLDVIDRLQLFANRDDLTPTDKVDRVRRATEIQIIAYDRQLTRRQVNQPISVSSFTVTYTSDNPQIAARVANELVTRVLEINLRSRSQQAQQTHDFFKQDVERLAADLIQLETEIANYKKQNEGSLPTTLGLRKNTFESVKSRLFGAVQQKAQKEEELRTLQDRLKTLENLPQPKQNLSQEEQQLSTLRSQLAQESTRLTDAHPLIRQLKGQIQAMEQVVGVSSGGSTASANQTLQIDSTKGQIALVENDIKLIDRSIQESTQQKDTLERTIADTPRVEAALNAFQRRLDDLRTRYQVAVAKQAEAETGEKLEIDQKAERFEVIEQARVPSAPVAPKRALIAIAGSIAALALGVGLALLLEILSSAIRTGAELERAVRLRPIATVPYIFTRAEVQRRRLVQGMAVLVFVVVIPSSLWVVDQFVVPMETITERVLDRTGLEQFWLDIKPRLLRV